MRGLVPPDPATKVSEIRFAVVYVPRHSRNRFPASCVELVASAEEALANADPDKKRYAAQVVGPSKSSEGLKIFYLLKWLE
jgi:hypothetical protein